jgi:hypothetical protein
MKVMPPQRSESNPLKRSLPMITRAHRQHCTIFIITRFRMPSRVMLTMKRGAYTVSRGEATANYVISRFQVGRTEKPEITALSFFHSFGLVCFRTGPQGRHRRG